MMCLCVCTRAGACVYVYVCGCKATIQELNHFKYLSSTELTVLGNRKPTGPLRRDQTVGSFTSTTPADTVLLTTCMKPAVDKLSGLLSIEEGKGEEERQSIMTAMLDVEEAKLNFPFLFDDNVPCPEPDLVCLQHLSLAAAEAARDPIDFGNFVHHVYKAGMRGYLPGIYFCIALARHRCPAAGWGASEGADFLPKIANAFFAEFNQDFEFDPIGLVESVFDPVNLAKDFTNCANMQKRAIKQAELKELVLKKRHSEKDAIASRWAGWKTTLSHLEESCNKYFPTTFGSVLRGMKRGLKKDREELTDDTIASAFANVERVPLVETEDDEDMRHMCVVCLSQPSLRYDAFRSSHKDR